MDKLKYMALADSLRAAILSGKYAHGEKLPSENELCDRFQFSRQTVRKAIGMLDAEGLTERVRGSGTYVKNDLSRRADMSSVAVVMTYIGEYILPTILSGIQEVLSENGYTPMIFATNNRVDNERRILEDLLHKPICGLIIEGTQSTLPNPNLDLYQKFEACGIPVLFLNSFYPELGDSVYVVTDDCKGGRIAAEQLIKRGHKKIAAIFKIDDRQGAQRYKGYMNALIEHGLDMPDDNILWYQTKLRKEIIEQFSLSTIKGCTAVVCYNDEVATQVLNLLLDHGISVPEDVAIISFDNSSMASVAAVKIASLDHPKKRMGIEIGRRIIKMMNGEQQSPLILDWGASEGESI